MPSSRTSSICTAANGPAAYWYFGSLDLGSDTNVRFRRLESNLLDHTFVSDLLAVCAFLPHRITRRLRDAPRTLNDMRVAHTWLALLCILSYLLVLTLVFARMSSSPCLYLDLYMDCSHIRTKRRKTCGSPHLSICYHALKRRVNTSPHRCRTPSEPGNLGVFRNS